MTMQRDFDTSAIHERLDVLTDEMKRAVDLMEVMFDSVVPDTAKKKHQRKILLREAWRDHYPGHSFHGAAKALALDWTAWREGPKPAAKPGTLNEVFQELDDLGFKPLAVRQLTTILDPGCD